MDLIASWIRIFDKHDNCRRFMDYPIGKTEKQLKGYYAVALKCYQIAFLKHKQIRDNIPQDIKTFY